MKKKFLAIVTAALIGTTAFAATASAASGTIDVISREDGSGTRGAFIELFGIEEKQGDEIRADLQNLAKEKGAEYLHNMLREIDPKSAEDIHANNIKRVIRALEYYQQTGQKISEHNEAEREKESAYNSAYFVLTDDRKILYDRIDKRVDLMMEEGLLEEVNALRLRGLKRESVAMQGLGYKELFGYFEGEYPLEEAVRIIKRDTRHFAKRQLTWFRRERDVIWLDKSEIGREDEQLIQQMLTVLKEKEIIH